MDLSKREKVIREIVDSFKKMCDYIEQTDGIGCGKCPVYKECFKEKHDGIKELIDDLDGGN